MNVAHRWPAPYSRHVAKRALDVVLVLVALPLAVPTMLLAAAAMAVVLRGNPFFLQRRIGWRGRPFTIVKLRTMRHALPGEARIYDIDDWSTFVFSPPGQEDPRTTRLGSLLRKTSIDEIPNLWNVARGDMSIVGPRPEIPEIVAQYPPEYHRRHDVLPGITGLAQVRGRSDLAYADVMKYDLAYVDKHSLLGDLRLMLDTVAVVVRGLGAR